MNKKITLSSTHKIPSDFNKIIMSDKIVSRAWEVITPLAKNEWICWIESAKKVETREKRVARARAEIKNGKKRPCCWAGCVHR